MMRAVVRSLGRNGYRATPGCVLARRRCVLCWCCENNGRVAAACDGEGLRYSDGPRYHGDMATREQVLRFERLEVVLVLALVAEYVSCEMRALEFAASVSCHVDRATTVPPTPLQSCIVVEL